MRKPLKPHSFIYAEAPVTSWMDVHLAMPVGHGHAGFIPGQSFETSVTAIARFQGTFRLEAPRLGHHAPVIPVIREVRSVGRLTEANRFRQIPQNRPREDFFFLPSRRRRFIPGHWAMYTPVHTHKEETLPILWSVVMNSV